MILLNYIKCSLSKNYFTSVYKMVSTIRNKLRYLCNDSIANVFKNCISICQEGSKYLNDNKTATAHRALTPVLLNRSGLRLRDGFGNKFNKMNNLDILKRHETKKRQANLSPKLLKGLTCSVTRSRIKLETNFFPNQKSTRFDQTLEMHTELPTSYVTAKNLTLNELPFLEQKSKMNKFLHYRPINEAVCIRRYVERNNNVDKIISHSVLCHINKRIKMNSIFIKKNEPKFLTLVEKKMKSIKTINVKGMSKLIDLNNQFCSGIHAKHRVIVYGPRRYYHKKIINYTKDTTIMKDNRNTGNNSFKTNTEVRMDIYTDSKQNNYETVNDRQHINKIYNSNIRNILDSKATTTHQIDQSYKVMKSDFGMNKWYANLATTQNLGTILYILGTYYKLQDRNSYANYIKNVIKNYGFILKRNFIKTKVNKKIDKLPVQKSKLDIDIIAKKLKNFYNFDRTPNMSKYTESNKLKLQKIECTDSNEQIKDSGDSTRKSEVNSSEWRILKHQHNKKIISSKPDSKSKYTLYEPYEEDTSLESHKLKRKVENTSINTDAQKEVKSDAKIGRDKSIIKGSNEKISEENKDTENTTAIHTETVKFTKSELKLPEKRAKNNSKSIIKSEIEKIDGNELAKKLFPDKETSKKQDSFAPKIVKNSNNYLNRIIEDNKNVEKISKEKIIMKFADHFKNSEKSRKINSKGFESEFNTINKNCDLPLKHSKTLKLLSRLSERISKKSESIFMRYKNNIKSDYEINDNRSNGHGSQLHEMNGKQDSGDKVYFVYKKQANKINFIDIEDKKQKLHKITNCKLNKKLASASVHFDVNKYKNKSSLMNVNLKKQSKPRNAEISKQIYDAQSYFRGKQNPKIVNVRNISTLNAPVKSPKHILTTKEPSRGVSVKNKQRYNLAKQFNHGSEFSAIKKKIKTTKPKNLGHVNPKREVMTKERKNSLERFKIFHYRIMQANMHQYDNHIKKIKYQTRLSNVNPLI